MSEPTKMIDPALVAECRRLTITSDHEQRVDSADRDAEYAANRSLVRAVVAALGDNPAHVENWRLSFRDTAIILSLELCPPGQFMGDFIYAYAIVCDTGQVCPINHDRMNKEEGDNKPPRRLSVIQGGRQ